MSVVLRGSPNDSCWGKVPVVDPLGAIYTVSHNTIGRIPRAGICINDGCWAGT